MQGIQIESILRIAQMQGHEVSDWADFLNEKPKTAARVAALAAARQLESEGHIFPMWDFGFDGGAGDWVVSVDNQENSQITVYTLKISADSVCVFVDVKSVTFIDHSDTVDLSPMRWGVQGARNGF